MPSQCAHGGVPLWCFPSRPLPALVGRALWLWLAVHLFGSAFGSAFESAFFGSYGSAFCYVSLLLEFSAFFGSAFGCVLTRQRHFCAQTAGSSHVTWCDLVGGCVPRSLSAWEPAEQAWKGKG